MPLTDAEKEIPTARELIEAAERTRGVIPISTTMQIHSLAEEALRDRAEESFEAALVALEAVQISIDQEFYLTDHERSLVRRALAALNGRKEK